MTKQMLCTLRKLVNGVATREAKARRYADNNEATPKRHYCILVWSSKLHIGYARDSDQRYNEQGSQISFFVCFWNHRHFWDNQVVFVLSRNPSHLHHSLTGLAMLAPCLAETCRRFADIHPLSTGLSPAIEGMHLLSFEFALGWQWHCKNGI